MDRSRVKTTDKHRIVFERVEELTVTGLNDAEARLCNIKIALRDIDINIERIKRHREILEFEYTEIEKYIANVKKSGMSRNTNL